MVRQEVAFLQCS